MVDSRRRPGDGGRWTGLTGKLRSSINVRARSCVPPFKRSFRHICISCLMQKRRCRVTCCERRFVSAIAKPRSWALTCSSARRPRLQHRIQLVQTSLLPGVQWSGTPTLATPLEPAFIALPSSSRRLHCPHELLDLWRYLCGEKYESWGPVRSLACLGMKEG